MRTSGGYPESRALSGPGSSAAQLGGLPCPRRRPTADFATEHIAQPGRKPQLSQRFPAQPELLRSWLRRLGVILPDPDPAHWQRRSILGRGFHIAGRVRFALGGPLIPAVSGCMDGSSTKSPKQPWQDTWLRGTSRQQHGPGCTAGLVPGGRTPDLSEEARRLRVRRARRAPGWGAVGGAQQRSRIRVAGGGSRGLGGEDAGPGAGTGRQGWRLRSLLGLHVSCTARIAPDGLLVFARTCRPRRGWRTARPALPDL